MPRLECHHPACTANRHYDGSACDGTGTTVDHYAVYDSRSRRTPHTHCRCTACHAGGYGSSYINECDGPQCGPHCERYEGQDLKDKGRPVAIRERDRDGNCSVCGSYSHSARSHGDTWWVSAEKPGHKAEVTDDLLAKLRATETADSALS